MKMCLPQRTRESCDFNELHFPSYYLHNNNNELHFPSLTSISSSWVKNNKTSSCFPQLPLGTSQSKCQCGGLASWCPQEMDPAFSSCDLTVSDHNLLSRLSQELGGILCRNILQWEPDREGEILVGCWCTVATPVWSLSVSRNFK